MVRLLNDRMEQIGCHARLEPGKFSRCLGVRGLHGTIKESADYWLSRAAALGEAAGRWARRALDARGTEALRSIMRLCHLADNRRASDINAACSKAIAAAANLLSFRTIKHLLEAGDHAPGQIQIGLGEIDLIIRPLSDYADFIRRQAPESDDFPQSEATKATEPYTPSIRKSPVRGGAFEVITSGAF